MIDEETRRAHMAMRWDCPALLFCANAAQEAAVPLGATYQDYLEGLRQRRKQHRGLCGYCPSPESFRRVRQPLGGFCRTQLADEFPCGCCEREEVCWGDHVCESDYCEDCHLLIPDGVEPWGGEMCEGCERYDDCLYNPHGELAWSLAYRRRWRLEVGPPEPGRVNPGRPRVPAAGSAEAIRLGCSCRPVAVGWHREGDGPSERLWAWLGPDCPLHGEREKRGG